MSAVLALFARQWRLGLRRRAEMFQPLVFYAIIVTLFALGSEPNSPLLAAFAPAVLWVAALLALLLGAERLFRDELEDGALEQWMLSPAPLPALLLAKLAAHWTLSGLPLVLVAPLIGLALKLPADANLVLCGALLLGTPALTLLCGFAAGLTVALPRAGVLLPVLVLPLTMPVLVFGAGCVRAAQSGLPVAAPLYFLAAILVLSVCLIPLAMAAALRTAIE